MMMMTEDQDPGSAWPGAGVKGGDGVVLLAKPDNDELTN